MEGIGNLGRSEAQDIPEGGGGGGGGLDGVNFKLSMKIATYWSGKSFLKT